METKSKVTNKINNHSSIGSPKNQTPKMCGSSKNQIRFLTAIISHGYEKITAPITASTNTLVYCLKYEKLKTHKTMRGRATKIPSQMMYEKGNMFLVY